MASHSICSRVVRYSGMGLPVKPPRTSFVPVRLPIYERSRPPKGPARSLLLANAVGLVLTG